MKPIRLPKLSQDSRQFTGVTNQIVFYILLVTSVPIILIGLFSFRAGSEGIRSHADAHFASVALIKSQEVERWFTPLFATSSTIARHPEVQASVLQMLNETTTLPVVEALDHIIPLSKGGPHHIDNLQAVRKTVNSLKGALLQEKFLYFIKTIYEHLNLQDGINGK